jgi:hypothetical protein
MIQLLIVLIVVGVLLWLVNQYVPMQPPFKTIVNVVAILLLCVYVLNLFDVINIPIGHRYR